MVQKTVVTVRIEANAGKQKGEGPPSDLWSWRKYGQKPIKGSPYPRGYYRCSTSKGCSAKKQVERCKTDASVLLITYTSDHNHPGPDPPTSIISIPTPPSLHSQPTEQQEDPPPTPNSPKQPTTTTTTTTTTSEGDPSSSTEENPHLLSPPKCSQDTTTTPQHPPLTAAEETERTHGHHLSILFDEVGPLPYSNIMTFPAAATTTQFKSTEENDFFDELEELPISSSFTGMMRSSSFFDERISLLPILD